MAPAEAPCREREDYLARPVEPLQIVDDDEQWSGGGRAAQERQRGV